MSADPQIVIEARKLARTYRVGDIEVQALRDVSLTVTRGELLAIMGASGSGKSTLMAILGCLDRPTAGEYRLEGRDIAALSEPELARVRSERLGFVFQSFNLLSRTSALDNVALPLIYNTTTPTSAASRQQRAHRVLSLLGLTDRERNTPAQLSGGQQQRVAIARALINNPTVLLADEPTGNLDTRNSHEIMQTLVDLNRRRGVTIIIVTHEPDIAAYADRVVTMRDGAITSDERRPQTAMPSSSASTEMAHEGASDAFEEVPEAASAPAVALRSWPFARMVLSTAAQALNRNKMRAGLTMLGVFIGVAALVAMVAVGQGANAAVKQQIQSLGTNMLVVLPGASVSGGVRGGFGSASTLSVADAEALRREDPAVAQVGYLIRQMAQVQYGDQNWTTNIQGITPSYTEIANWHIAQGRAVDADDVASGSLVAVIGQTVYSQLFNPYENPIGATILVKGTPLKVVGLYQAKGQSANGQDQDDLVTIPFSTAERKILGVAAPTQAQSANSLYPPLPNPFGVQPRLTGYVNLIYAQAVNAASVDRAIDEVTATLRRRHRISASDLPDFNVRNLSQIASAAEGSSRVMALLLATVASISLLVGGIGIMNILLVSVTERTREIGLRMALGARRLHVLLQFLAEAVFLSVAGGLAGIAMGVAVSEVVSAVAGWPIVISPTAMAGGFLFAAAIGIFFGFYPARKAAGLDPIEALRYE
ncbi:MAG TPA: ABC transporter permease [Steroidobacteraceae bacterium]|nr:ABC transporter permease [Steroidobacteraceae bacterium]